MSQIFIPASRCSCSPVSSSAPRRRRRRRRCPRSPGRSRDRVDVSQPAVNVVPEAAKVEDFPYLTEEFFVSGTVNGTPYTTRIIVRRPKDAGSFSGTVVAEALHAGGRSLIFEWSRSFDPDAAARVCRDRAQRRKHQPAENFQRRAVRDTRHRQGQTNEVIAQVGRLIKSKTGPFAAPRRQARDPDGHFRIERDGAHVSGGARQPADARQALRSSTAFC